MRNGRGAFLRALLFCAVVGVAGCVESNNRAPEILPVDDVVFEAGIPNFIEIGALDPDGDTLRFSLRLDPTPPSVIADPSTAPRVESVTQGAILTWMPTAMDGAIGSGTVYVATLIAEDGRGGKAGRALRITVVQVESERSEALRFDRPLYAGLFTEARCLDAVSIQAVGVDDLSAVLLGVESESLPMRCGEMGAVGCPMIEADGSEPGSGQLNWCPTGETLAGHVHHDLRLVAASPGTDMVARQPFFVRFDWPPPPECQESPPNIVHDPPARGIRGSAPVISAEFDGVADLKTPPVLAYTIAPTGSAPTPLQWQAVTFASDGSGQWTASPQLPPLDAGEDDLELSYRIVVTADPASDDSSCHATMKSEIYRVQLHQEDRPADLARHCDECSLDADCAGGGTLCIPIEGQGFCMKACTAADDCTEGESCAQAESIDGVIGTQCIPSDLNCGQLCHPDEFEGEFGNESQAEAHRVEVGEYDALTVCGGDSDWYRLHVEEGAALRVQVTFDANEGDLDLSVHTPGVDGDATQSASGQRDEEFIDIPCVRREGDALIHVWGHAQAENSYRLTVETQPGRCEVGCAVDSSEELTPDMRWRGLPVELPWESLGLTVCQGDVDRFFFRPDHSMRVSAHFGYEAQAGALSMKIYRGEAIIQELAPSAGEQGRAVINTDPDATYVIEVAGATPEAMGSYRVDLQVSQHQAPVGPCDDENCLGLPCIDDNECGEAACTPRQGLRIRDAVSGLCARRCEVDDECERGYACKHMGGQRRVCLPTGAQGPGASCTGHWECAGDQVCLAGPGGYCASLGCRVNECPGETVCAPWGDELACHAECRADADCRGARGYTCSSERVRGRRYCEPEEED